MIQLQYGVKVDNKKYIMIMDDEEMQEKLLQNIDVRIIPDCYFDFELREVGELW